MKKIHLLFGLMIFLLVLTACAPTAGSLTTPTEPALPSPAETETPPADPPKNLTSDPNLTGTEPPPTAAEPDPEDSLVGAAVDWDPSPDVQVIKATFCCGFVHPLTAQNYIPAAVVYGDGRIVWSQMDGQGQRQVQVGQLEAGEMAALVEEMVAAGFLEWDELYTDPMAPSDLPSQCITLNLEDQSKQVCEYYQGAPQDFHDLYDRLAQGAGAEGQPYTPVQGLLIATAVGPEETASAPEWDAADLGLSLADAAPGGTVVEGPALEMAWDLVNTNSWGPTVQEDGQLYQIALQIPGLNTPDQPGN